MTGRLSGPTTGICPLRGPAPGAAGEGAGRPLGSGPVLADHEQQHRQVVLRLEIRDVVRPARLLGRIPALLGFDGEYEGFSVRRGDAYHGVYTALQWADLRHVGDERVHGHLLG